MQVLDILTTPNPNAVKVLVDAVLGSQTRSFFNASTAQNDPLAKACFGIPGVTSLMILDNFITVSKAPQIEWETLLPLIQETLGAQG